MELQREQLYHIYNRGNNRQRVFLRDDHYLLFLKKLRDLLPPQVHIVAWCLRPNHFHLLAQLRDTATAAQFNAALCTLLSSYTRALNHQLGRTGSLFQQGTKAKQLDSDDYALNCFCYIHQNPARAALETTPGEWPWSSFQDYAGHRSGTLCNHALATELLDLPPTAAERRALMLQVPPDGTRAILY